MSAEPLPSGPRLHRGAGRTAAEKHPRRLCNVVRANAFIVSNEPMRQPHVADSPMVLGNNHQGPSAPTPDACSRLR
jgi:hypothetical protein